MFVHSWCGFRSFVRRGRCAGLFLITFGVIGFVSAACGNVITVNTAGDNQNPADGKCSLREAIVNANQNADTTAGDCLSGDSNPVVDEIRFNIPGSGIQTLSLTQPLPSVKGAVKIDGTTQPGASCDWRNLNIEINGQQAGWTSGLIFQSGSYGSQIKGLVINRFQRNGVEIDNVGGVSLVCNHIGTDPSAVVARPNGNYGVSVSGAYANSAVIGGSDFAERNIISGNTWSGILLNESFGHVVRNNCIGTDINCVREIPNQGHGIGVSNFLTGLSQSSLIQGNVIAFNQQRGIFVQSTDSVNKTITANSIHDNGHIGIDLNNDIFASQVTLNDFGDSDNGPNHFLNYPDLQSAQLTAGVLQVKFALDAPQGKYRIEFFANPSGMDPSGHGEGEIYLGFVGVTTDSVPGPANYTVNLTTPSGVNPADVINLTATTTEALATGALGSTSEFSGGVEVKRVFYDYGDAPDPSSGTSVENYRTRKADLGPSHKVGKVYLGACVDGDDGLAANLSADADDVTTSVDVLGDCLWGDDEDGILWPENLPPYTTAHIPVTASAKGYVNGWIDWNHDGDFADANEKIWSNVLVAAGVNLLDVYIPGNLPSGTTTIARVRINTTGQLNWFGPAADGEVEDYRVHVIGDFRGEDSGLKAWSPVADK